MRLCLAAGRLDVDAVMQQMTSAQLEEWRAFERIEGFSIGARGDWERSANLASLYAEMHRDRRKRPHPFTAADFLPWLRAQLPKITQRAWRAQFPPGMIIRKGKGKAKG